MEKMSAIFFVIIVAYLLYAFFKSRSERIEKKDIKIKETEKNTGPSTQEKNKDTEKAAIAALIAAVMGETAYVIKRVYAVATVDERSSSWRYAGRNEQMTRKKTLQ
jgi:uncharacterized membrane protein